MKFAMTYQNNRILTTFYIQQFYTDVKMIKTTHYFNV